MQIKLSDHFTYRRLIRYVLPTIAMMIFTSVYGIVDGLFVSNFAGKTAFAAINLVSPALMIISSVGFMIGAGGTAIVSKTMGEGRADDANRYFSMLIYITMGFGIVISVVVAIFLPNIVTLLGADGELHRQAVLYGRIGMCTMTCYMLQNMFQSFFVAAERPKRGLAIIVVAGVMNMILDAVFVALLGWGIAGAAVATCISECIAGIYPIIYFARKNDSRLQLVKTSYYGSVLGKACVNGSSEFMANIASSVVGIVFNIQLLKYAGETGVAAYGIIMYAGWIIAAIYMGYAVGSAPIASFNYGAQNTYELKNIFTKSIKMIGIGAVSLTTLGFLLARPITWIFASYDQELMDMTVHGFRIFIFSVLMMGFNMYGSSFFTALGNGLISALISFMRTLVFELGAVLILPVWFGMNGIWSSVIVAEVAAITLTTTLLLKYSKRYKYL